MSLSTRQIVEERYKRGTSSLSEIAKIAGVSRQRVWQIVQDIEIGTSYMVALRERKRKEREEEILTLHKKGMNGNRIANSLNIGSGSVYNVFRKYNINYKNNNLER